MPINQGGGFADMLPLLSMAMQKKAQERQDMMRAEELLLAKAADTRAAEAHAVELKARNAALKVAQLQGDGQAALIKLGQQHAERQAASAATVNRPGGGGLPPVQESATRVLPEEINPLGFSDNLPLVVPGETGVTPAHQVDFETPMMQQRVSDTAKLGQLPLSAVFDNQQMVDAALIGTGQKMTAAQGFSLFDSFMKAKPNAVYNIAGVAEALRGNDYAGAWDNITSMGTSDAAINAQKAYAGDVLTAETERLKAYLTFYGTQSEVMQRDRASQRTFTSEDRKVLPDLIAKYSTAVDNLGSAVSKLEDQPGAQGTIRTLLAEIPTLVNDLEGISARAYGRDPGFVHIYDQGWFGGPTLNGFERTKATHPFPSGGFEDPLAQAARMEAAYINGEETIEVDDVGESDFSSPLGLINSSPLPPGLNQPMNLDMPAHMGLPGATLPGRTPSLGLPITSDPKNYESLGSKKLNIPKNRQANAREWVTTMEQTELKLELPKGILAAMTQVESNWDPNATSPSGARGLIQFMPATAADVAKLFKDPVTAEQVMADPNLNIMGAGMYMRGLLDRYDGDIPRALTAYNAGMGKVSEIIKLNNGDLGLDNTTGWDTGRLDDKGQPVTREWKDEQRVYASKVMSYMDDTAPRLPTSVGPTTAPQATSPQVAAKDFTIGNTPVYQRPEDQPQYTASSAHLRPAALAPKDSNQQRIVEWEQIAQEQVIPALLQAGMDGTELRKQWFSMGPSQRVQWTMTMLKQLQQNALPQATPSTPLALPTGIGSANEPYSVKVTAN